MKLVLLTVLIASLASCVETTTTAPDGTVTKVKAYDPNAARDGIEAIRVIRAK